MSGFPPGFYVIQNFDTKMYLIGDGKIGDEVRTSLDKRVAAMWLVAPFGDPGSDLRDIELVQKPGVPDKFIAARDESVIFSSERFPWLIVPQSISDSSSSKLWIVKSGKADLYWLNVGLLPVGEVILSKEDFKPANAWSFIPVDE